MFVVRSDATHHWQECEKCGETTEKRAHTGGKATCLAPAQCEVCGAAYGEKGAHEFSVTSHDDKNHWRECAVCGEKMQLEPHAGGRATCLAPAQCEVCGAPYGTRAPHTGGTATCVQKAVCEVCGSSYGEYAAHAPESEWRSDTQTHWHPCAVCNAKTDEAAHTEDGGTVITQPTANGAGLKAYRCTVCGRQVRTEYIPATGVSSSSGASSSSAPASSQAASSQAVSSQASSAPQTSSSPQASSGTTAPSASGGRLSSVILIGVGLLAASAAVCAVILIVNLRRR